MPTVEEVNPHFAGARIFSKLDAKAGYWSVPLEENSQLLTTFRTPIGRFCFRRLPFGLNISQDIFQQRIDEILEPLEGCVGIADDICVFGATEEEHDSRLLALMEAARASGLVFNSDKCAIKKDKISFFGNIYSTNGIAPDPVKVKDLRNMATPQNTVELQKFLGLLTYMSPFIPNLSKHAAPLRDLVKEGSTFTWNEEHQKVFDILRTIISEDSTIAYYQTDKPLTLEVDASMRGLGAVMMQEGRPVAYASKTLNKTQSNYSNIEREMLAVVHGVERFHTYLYGRSFTIITDHKPLEMVCHKPLMAVPPRLQRLLLRIQGYDYRVIYRPGEEAIVPDVLSRLPNPSESGEISHDLRVDDIELDLINFNQTKQEILRTETRRCPIMSTLTETVLEGWPKSIKELPTDIRVFWPFRDTIGIEDGVIFKGKQVIIPASMREDILNQLHDGHQGIEKTRLLARDTVYWPNINDDITRMVGACPLCQELQVRNTKEPLLQTEIPPKPWTLLGTDLFEIKGRYFVIISDYFSKFPIVRELSSPISSASVTKVMAEMCGIFGRPNEIRSDNGPQYSGEAFKSFCRDWEIKHTTSSPHYSKSNGFIERQIRWIKPMIKKCLKNNQSINKALLIIRATPIDSKVPSPAELLMGHKITTFLPSHTEEDESMREHLRDKQRQMKTQYDKTARKEDLPPLYPGQNIRVFNKAEKSWHPGTVIEKCLEPRSYMIKTPFGSEQRRNRSHIRESRTETRTPSVIHAQPVPTPIVNPIRTPATDTEKDTPNENNQRTRDGDIEIIRTRSGRMIRPPQRLE